MNYILYSNFIIAYQTGTCIYILSQGINTNGNTISKLHITYANCIYSDNNCNCESVDNCTVNYEYRAKCCKTRPQELGEIGVK